MNYDIVSDEFLINLIKKSDEKAFKALFSRYVKFVFRLALRKVFLQDKAEDIAQQIFLSIWERRQDLKIDSLEAYLRTAVKYRCITYLESKYTRLASLEITSLEQYIDHSTSDKILYDELKMAIQKALLLLPLKTRHVFELSRFKSQSNREIAALLNISEKSVEYHMTQSLKVMRHELKDYLKVSMQTFVPLTILLQL